MEEEKSNVCLIDQFDDHCLALTGILNLISAASRDGVEIDPETLHGSTRAALDIVDSIKRLINGDVAHALGVNLSSGA